MSVAGRGALVAGGEERQWRACHQQRGASPALEKIAKERLAASRRSRQWLGRAKKNGLRKGSSGEAIMSGNAEIDEATRKMSFLAGLAASGVLTSALRLITKATFEHNHDGLRKGAMLFFAVASLLELISLLLYAYVFPKLSIVKYYRSKAASEGLKTVSADLAAAGIRVHNKQEDTGKHVLGQWYALVLITSYNVLDFLGRYTPLGPEANALGNLLVVFLLGGLFSGVALDWLWLIGKGW
ncbi:Equilibrative nucleotide transporter 3 [Platanthera guangdongensis]|uniref:Equilibrative nucleotide transporter 3 n=1 Tax=Platanthera guangdongensis TaxID=2320717 RepID=A0ABR2MXK9_9ASPA